MVWYVTITDGISESPSLSLELRTDNLASHVPNRSWLYKLSQHGTCYTRHPAAAFQSGKKGPYFSSKKHSSHLPCCWSWGICHQNAYTHNRKNICVDDVTCSKYHKTIAVHTSQESKRVATCTPASKHIDVDFTAIHHPQPKFKDSRLCKTICLLVPVSS